MTTLVVHELVTELAQEFTLNLARRYDVAAFYPYLYMHNAPAGTFTFSILQGVTTIFSKAFTSADIKSALSTANNYAHVFYPVIPSDPLLLNSGDYTAKITASGYTFSVSSFLGWIQQHEDLNNELDYTPANDIENPLSMRIKETRKALL
jgi:membrane-bound metal-dependent hydrolase YbcI (DUF457 family)